MSRRPTMDAQRAMLAVLGRWYGTEAGGTNEATLANECGGRWRATLDVVIAKGWAEFMYLGAGGSGYGLTLAGLAEAGGK